jgi:hypothetical protein
MAQYRNISTDERGVVYGVPGGRGTWVPVDGLVTISDDVTDSYDCQPAIWQRVGSTGAGDSGTAGGDAGDSGTAGGDAGAGAPSVEELQAEIAHLQAEVPTEPAPEAPVPEGNPA